MKFARLSLATTLLISCTMAPHTQPTGVQSVQSKNAASKPRAAKPVQRQLPPEALLESAQGKAQASRDGDMLNLQVVIRRPDARVQRLELDRIRRLRAWVQGPGIEEQIFNLDDFVVVQDQNQQTQLQIEKIPRGKNRIVTVQGYDFLDEAPEELNGATLKAVYDSPPNSTQVTLTFTWRSTLLAEVIENFLAQIEAEQDPAQRALLQELLDNLDRSALDVLLDHIVYGTETIGGSDYRLHPDRVNAPAIVDAIIQAQGTVPIQLRTDPVNANFQESMADLSLVVRNAQNAVFANSEIRVQITDPASVPVLIASGNDTAAVNQIVPGTWKGIASIDGLNGGVKGEASVIVDANGVATLLAGTAGNPLLLPPVIKALSKTQGGVGTQLTLTGDGFHPTATQNTVRIGNQNATVVSGTPTSLVVEIPDGLEGDQEITVTSSAKTSNVADFKVVREITQISINQGVQGNSVTLTLAGYDPTADTPTVSFAGNQSATITHKTANTITVTVPNGAESGPITVTPSAADGGQPLLSPSFQILAPAAPSLSSPGGQPGSQVTINVANYDPTADTPTVSFEKVGGGSVPATILSKNSSSITVSVPFQVQTGPITITPSAADGRAPFTSPEYAIGKPVISSFTPDTGTPSQTVTVTGANLNNLTEVKIGDQVVPLGSITPIDSSSFSFPIPPGASTGPISVTNAEGSATSASDLTVPLAVVSLSEPAGNVNDTLTINVTGFDPSQVNTTVTFPSDSGGVTAVVTGRTADSITVTVPAGAKTGKIQLEPQGLQTLETPVYTVGDPVITAVGPGNGPFTTGQTISVTTNNLGNATGVTVGGQAATFNVDPGDPNTLLVTIPDNPANTTLQVSGDNGTASTTINLLLPPVIETLVPPVPNNPATTITLNGSNYTTVNQVTIGGQVIPPADYTIVSDTQIIINNVPNDPVLGPIKVNNPAGSDLASLTYKNVQNFIGHTNQADNVLNDFRGFCGAHGVNADSNGNIYVSDLGCGTLGDGVHKFTSDGTHVWSTGSTAPTSKGYRDGTIESAQFNAPEDSATDRDGHVYVADTSNHAIRKIYTSGPNAGLVKTLARVPGPEGIEISPQGKLYVTSTYPPNNTSPESAHVLEIADLDSILTDAERDNYVEGATSFTANVTIVSGGAATNFPAFGSQSRSSARFRHLEGLGVDGNGHIYVADVDLFQIRKIDLVNNTVSVFANTIFPSYFGAQVPTTLSQPTITMHELRVDALGNVFVPAPSSNNQLVGPAFGVYIYKQDGSVNFIAGDTERGNGLADGPPLTQAEFSSARGIDIGPDGSLYVADTTWGIRKIERFHPVTGLQVP